MKRMVALLMIFGLFALSCLPAMAAEQQLLTVTGDTTCAPGSTFTLNFGVVEGTKLSALNVEVSYDTDTFEFVEYQNGDLITDALAAGNGTEGKVLFTLATLTPITKGGTLFTATFKVDSKAKDSHSFFFYSTLFNVDDGSATGKDLDAAAVEHIMKVEGKTVSEVSVTPVYSQVDDKGTQSVVSAQNGESATGVLVPGASQNNTPSSSSQPQGQEGGQQSKQWVIVGVVVLVLGALALLVVAAVAKAKKGDKELGENQSILTDDAKALLDLEKDALENKEDQE